MECKHGTSEPCDLCVEEDAEHDREMAIQARIDAAVAAERERCAKLCDEAAERLRNSGCKHEAAAVETVAEDLRA